MYLSFNIFNYKGSHRARWGLGGGQRPGANRKRRKMRCGEESRSQVTENSLGFEDYLADISLQSLDHVHSQGHCLPLGLCSARHKQKQLNIPPAIRSISYDKGHLTGTVVIMNTVYPGA